MEWPYQSFIIEKDMPILENVLIVTKSKYFEDHF